MAQLPPYSADRFPSDFFASLRGALIAAALSGPSVWYLSLRYLRHRYPQHTELEPAAVVAGCVDAALFGLAAFVATFAVRIWRFEREERKRSDHLLRLALDDIQNSREGGV